MRNAQSTPTRLPMLSLTAEYALRAVLYLSRRRAPGPVSSNEMATALGAPANYLGKTLRRLAQRGVLRSARGPRGGFELAVDPTEITPAQIVEAVDEVTGPRHCLMGDRLCSPEDPCDVHDRWTELMERVLRPLEETSVADLLGSGPAAPESQLNASSQSEVKS